MDLESKPESDKKQSEDSNGTKKEKLAGIPVSVIKNNIKEFYLGRDDWRDLSIRRIRRAVEKDLDLEKGALDLDEFDELIDLVVDENRYEKEDIMEKNRKLTESTKLKREQEKKKDQQKKDDKEKDSKDKRRKSNQDKETKSNHKSKRSRETSSDPKHSPKKRRYNSSSSSDSDDPRLARRDPILRKIKQIRGVMRGCGIQITGISNTMSKQEVLVQLRKILAKYEKLGVKEKMTRKEMLKARENVAAQNEIEELQNIPEKLQVNRTNSTVQEEKILESVYPKLVKIMELLKSVLNEIPPSSQISYDLHFPKTGLPYLDDYAVSSSSSTRSDNNSDSS